MNKIFLVVVFSIISISALAQKCEYDEEKTDAFTNLTTKKTYHSIGPAAWQWKLQFVQEGNNKFLNLQTLLQGVVNDKVPKGNELLIKLEDGTILTLKSVEDVSATSNAVGLSIYSIFIIKHAVDNEILTKLANSKITNLKIKVTSFEYDLPKITSKQGEKIQKTAHCFID